MIAPSAWLQSRQAMWINRKNFLRDFARCQGWGFDVADISLDELFELIGADDETKEQLTAEFQKELTDEPFFKAFEQAIEENPNADIDALFEELERQYPEPDDELEPAIVFVSPAVTVRRTAPNANKGVGRGTNGTGNKDPSDPDGDGDGDGDSSSILNQKQTSPRPQRGLERRSLSCKSILH